MMGRVDSGSLEEARFFYDLASKLYEDTNASNDLLNQKIHNMLAVTGTAVLILTGFFYYVLSNIQRQVPRGTYWIVVAPVIIGLIFLLTAILLGFHAYKSWTFKGFSAIRFVEKHYGNGLLNALEHAASNLVAMTEENQKRLEKKAVGYHRMLYMLTLGVLFLIGGFVVLILAN